MHAQEIIDRYRAGVTFACGCQEMGIHPAVERALLGGRLEPASLTRCATHRQPIVGLAPEGPGGRRLVTA